MSSAPVVAILPLLSLIRGEVTGALVSAWLTGIMGTSLYSIVRRLGEVADVKVRPHGLRHAAITDALDQTNGDVRAVHSFSRHSKVETVMAYDANRLDLGGAIATLVADAA